MTHRFTYLPGTSTAVCVGEWAVLIGIEPTHPAVPRLYGLLLGEPTMDALTDVLAETYGDFRDVVVVHSGDPNRVFVWGDVGTETTTGEGIQGGRIGEEEPLTGLVGAWVGTTPVPSGAMLPAGHGVFLADRIETMPPPPPPAPQPAEAQVAAPPAEAPTPVPEPVPVPPAPAPTPQSRFSPAGSPVPPGPVPYGAPIQHVPSSHLSPALVPQPAAAPYRPVAPAPPGVGYRPTSPQAVPPQARESYVPSAPPPVSGRDIRQQVEIDSTISPQRVLVRACPHGHVNPAFLEECTRCGQWLGGAPMDVPQPSLGRLVISTGGFITLDHDAVVGRNPILPPGLVGVPPELVRVSDPSRDVSNRHLQVKVKQWQVTVRDLGSTNGTEVLRPGWPPQALTRGQETAIEPGAQVVLAGVVTLTYEVD